jgi:hypothetical protein
MDPEVFEMLHLNAPDLDVQELEQRLELASMMPDLCYINTCGCNSNTVCTCYTNLPC